MPTSMELLTGLEETGEAFASFLETQSTEAIRRRPDSEAWSAAQLAGHVAELLPYWADQAHRVADRPGLPLGRNADDPGRLAGVTKLDDASPSEAAAAVRDGVRQAVGILGAIPPAGWQARGRHQSGEMTAAEVVERFIVRHIPEHLDQARAAVGV